MPFTVTYTKYVCIKGENTNQYKQRHFRLLWMAEEFAESLRNLSNITDIQILY